MNNNYAILKYKTDLNINIYEIIIIDARDVSQKKYKRLIIYDPMTIRDCQIDIIKSQLPYIMFYYLSINKNNHESIFLEFITYHKLELKTGITQKFCEIIDNEIFITNKVNIINISTMAILLFLYYLSNLSNNIFSIEIIIDIWQYFETKLYLTNIELTKVMCKVMYYKCCNNINFAKKLFNMFVKFANNTKLQENPLSTNISKEEFTKLVDEIAELELLNNKINTKMHQIINPKQKIE